MKKLIAFLLVFVMASSVMTTSLAIECTDKNENTSDISYENAIEVLSEYISISDKGTMYINEKTFKHKINREIYLNIINGMEAVNTMIVAGYLVADENGNIIITEKYEKAEIGRAHV